LVREIAWSHNIIILEKREADPEREFYIRMTGKFGWTKNVLALQNENQIYQKTLQGQTNFDRTVPARLRRQAKLACNVTDRQATPKGVGRATAGTPSDRADPHTRGHIVRMPARLLRFLLPLLDRFM
jgi:hypothetical protein